VSRTGPTLERMRYAATQSARVAWYSAHYALARRFSRPLAADGAPPFRPKSAAGDRAQVRAAFLSLFAQDRANIEAGLYLAPDDFSLARMPELLADSRRFFKDLPRVDARRMERRAAEVREINHRGHYPPYYLQNFHFQDRKSVV